jgi:hypothetical protein
MIKFTSFYPFSHFSRVTQEFYEDKAVVKTQSLTYEREFEFNFKDVGEISDGFFVSPSRKTFSFWLIILTSFTLSIFFKSIQSNLILFRLIQIIYIVAFVLFVTSFVKVRHIRFIDKKDNFLTSIKQTRHNHDLILQVIEMIKNKSENVQEISSTNPFPEVTPSFEHIEYDIPNMKKTTERFYENEILGYQKNSSSDYGYSIKYNRLSGKIYRGKTGYDIWCSVLTIIVLIISVISGLIFGFGIHLSMVFIYGMYVVLATIFAISFIMKFVKREVVGLYDMNGNVEHWLWVNRSNKEKIEEIIEFVQSKIPAENKV